MRKNAKPTTPVTPEPARIRNVRLHLPDRLYRQVRHRLADADPQTSISVVIADLIEAGLSKTA